MDVWQELVLGYFTFGRPHVFVNPEYWMAEDPKLPDFVVLNFREKVVSIAEVSSAIYLEKLKKKAKYLETTYLQKLKAQLLKDSVVNSSWQYVLEFFVRAEMIEKFQWKLGLHAKHHVHALEEIFPWKLEWPRR